MELIQSEGKMCLGSCCKDLRDAINEPPNSLFVINEHDILYLSVGYVLTDDGLGWFDQAVLFCPFCGTKIQDKDDIAQKVKEK